MAINDAAKSNFKTLQSAFSNDSVALVECKDSKTGEYVPTICAVHMEGEEIVFTPFAKMFTGNPYEELLPPGELSDDEKSVRGIQ